MLQQQDQNTHAVTLLPTVNRSWFCLLQAPPSQGLYFLIQRLTVGHRSRCNAHFWKSGSQCRSQQGLGCGTQPRVLVLACLGYGCLLLRALLGASTPLEDPYLLHVVCVLSPFRVSRWWPGLLFSLLGTASLLACCSCLISIVFGAAVMVCRLKSYCAPKHHLASAIGGLAVIGTLCV